MTKNSWRIVTALYVVFLTYVSLMPESLSAPHSVIKEMLHNLCHIPAYTILTLLLLKNFYTVNVRAKIFSWLIAIFYGGVMEILQSFSPGRTPSFSDEMLNALGALIAVLIVEKIPKIFKVLKK